MKIEPFGVEEWMNAYEDKAPYAFTGKLKKVVFDLKPAHMEAEQALHEHAMVNAVAAGAAA